MDSWQRFNETSLTDKKGFYRSLTIEDIIDSDYKHAKNRLWRFQDTKLRRVLWIISTKWYTAIVADILPELLQQVHRNIQSLSQVFFFDTNIIMKNRFQKAGSRIEVVDWCWYATHGRKKLQRTNVLCCTLICKS